MSQQMNAVQKGQIIGLHKSGKSARFIAKSLNTTHRSVSLWIHRYNKTGNVNREVGSGRKHILSNEEAQEVVAAAVDNPFFTAHQIKEELKLEVTSRTIRNILREASLESRVAARKPFLTENQRQQRLLIARSHLTWGMSEWSSVLFTDESSIQSYASSPVKVYRPQGCKFDPKYTQKRKRSGRISLSVWGSMSMNGIGNLHRIEGCLTASQYCDILQHVMLPDVLDHHFLDGYFLFQQDKSPIHTSKRVSTWLENNVILELEWPSKGADLNPIENVWSLWKRGISMHNIKTSDDLWNVAHASWENLKNYSDLPKRLVESMPRRLQKVIDNDGQYTKY